MSGPSVFAGERLVVVAGGGGGRGFDCLRAVGGAVGGLIGYVGVVGVGSGWDGVGGGSG